MHRARKTALKGDHARTRFIIGLERAVEFQVFALTNPNRVFVELPDVKLQLPPASGRRARRPRQVVPRRPVRRPARRASSSTSPGR